ncbi:MAG: threonine-phosphate decarboxylase [Pseudomonadota bacterium]
MNKQINAHLSDMDHTLSVDKRDHGGGLDAARATFGGSRRDWLDLSTGINPHHFPVPDLAQADWTALPDENAYKNVLQAARRFWRVPAQAGIVAAAGASVLIAQLPGLIEPGSVVIPGPTYNEHAAAFYSHGWRTGAAPDAKAQVVVHPNNPDGRLWREKDLPLPKADLTVIDESFCDVQPDASLIDLTTRPGTVVLKSFGKFWGLAGMRLGFAIGDPTLIAVLRDRLGPWAVAGPALRIAAEALNDAKWATDARIRLTEDSQRLDTLMTTAGASVVGGTSLFRLYEVNGASAWQDRLARHHVWSRIFPYSDTWLRLGLPPAHGWDRLERAAR